MICANCGNEIAPGVSFCTQCGAAVNQQVPPQQNAGQQVPPPQPNYGQVPPQYQAYDPTDHTAEFDPKDISDNKVIAMLPYIVGLFGVLIAIIAAKDSAYVSFHVRQALKYTVCEALLGIIVAVLCWTIIVPIAGGVCFIIIFVCRLISFFSICSGKAKEAPIIKSFGFLK